MRKCTNLINCTYTADLLKARSFGYGPDCKINSKVKKFWLEFCEKIQFFVRPRPDIYLIQFESFSDKFGLKFRANILDRITKVWVF